VYPAEGVPLYRMINTCRQGVCFATSGPDAVHPLHGRSLKRK
jgi:hypothetical protein